MEQYRCRFPNFCGAGPAVGAAAAGERANTASQSHGCRDCSRARISERACGQRNASLGFPDRQARRAACAGRVVYTGSGLRGYGNLIILKHADSLLSAYGHNREMLVRDGQEVAAGQVIAHMGERAPRAPVLYFEIRHNGKPVDPLPFISQ